MKVFAKIPYVYGGRNLDRGEIFDLRGLRNDDKLVGMHLALVFDSRVHRIRSCPVCGRQFADEHALDGHRRKPDCLAEQPEPTKSEIAALHETEIDKVVVE